MEIIYFSILLVISSVSVYGDVQFQYDSEQCLGEPVEYQCTVTGSPFMQWTVLDDEGVQVVPGIQLFSSGGIGGIGMLGEFSVEQLQASPSIITNISFTVQSSINGYTIICCAEYQINTVSENVTIQIPEPSIPQSVIVHNDSFTNSSVRVSWAESSFTQSRCFGKYHVNVSSTTKNIIMESTSNSVMVEGLVPSDDQYCVVVTAIDINGNSGNGSDPVCFIFNVPSNISELMIFNDTEYDSSNTIEVTVQWDKPIFKVSDNTLTVPVITGYEVSIVNTTDSDSVNMTVLLSASSLEHTFTGVPTGRTYTITVTTINDVGKGSPTVDYLDAPGLFYSIIPIPTSVSTTATKTSFIDISTSSITSSSSLAKGTRSLRTTVTTSSAASSVISVTVNSCAGLSSSVSAGISVAITVPVTAVITAIITVIILYLYERRVSRQSSNKVTPPQDYEIPISTNEVEMKGNTAYGQVIANKKSITVPTGTEYESVYM